MNRVRIGQKVIWPEKIYETIDQLLQLRSQGYSQQEVAQKLALDRAFISRVEGLGEIRKGASVAVVGFPIANKDEVVQLFQQAGVDYWLLFTETERLAFVQELSGIELVNQIMQIITEFRQFDVVVVLGSDRRIKLVETLMEAQVVGLELGVSPLTADQHVPLDKLREVLGGIGLLNEKMEAGEKRDELNETCS